MMCKGTPEKIRRKRSPRFREKETSLRTKRDMMAWENETRERSEENEFKVFRGNRKYPN
jgi:ribosomal protein S12 methylthiotransferase accessory factor YcaO